MLQISKKKEILIIILILTILLFSACNKVPTGNSAERRKQQMIASTTPQKEIICNKPTKLVGTECCIDNNNNSLCDKYEELCGDGKCSENETKCSCAEDCGECETQNAPLCQLFTCIKNQCVLEDSPVCCGNGVCEESETCSVCFQDCCEINEEKATLINYPEDFQFWDIVIGNNAPQEDVIIGGEIFTHIAQEDYQTGKAKLADQIILNNDDYIVLGNPCDNAAAFELWKKEIIENENDCQIFESGEAIIKFFATSQNNVALYVGGFETYDTYRAANVLITHDDFEDLDGKEFIITGTKSRPKATKVN